MRPLAVTLAGAVLGGLARAQSDLSQRLRPMPNPPIPIRYETRTRTLHREPGPSAFFGPEVIYANTCPSGMFLGLSPGDQIFASGEVPAPNDGILAAAGSGGCSDMYGVSGFEIAYCSNQPSNDVLVLFLAQCNPCTDIPRFYSCPCTQFLLPGLPGSSTGGAACYAVTVDLGGTSLEFSLIASADGSWNNNDALDSFGYTYEFTNLTGTDVGPVVAGNPVFLGQGCDFTVGTIFEVADTTGSEPEGTGYFSQDAFRLQNGGMFFCSYFGGWPANQWASFHLRLFSGDSGCTSDVLAPTCAGDGGYPTNVASVCPCGNVSSPGTGEGCVNSSGSHGGTIHAPADAGASVTLDDLTIVATHPAGNGGLLLVNNGLLNPGNASTGFDGIACVGGGPRILPGADNGMNGDKVAFDGRRQIPGVIGAANAVSPGFIAAGSTYYLQYWYRDVLCGPPPAPCVTPCTTPPPGAANFTNAASFVATP